MAYYQRGKEKIHLRRYNPGKNQNKYSQELVLNSDRVLELYYFFVCMYVSLSIPLPFSLLVCLSCMSVCLSPCPSLFMCVWPPLPHEISVSLSLCASQWLVSSMSSPWLFISLLYSHTLPLSSFLSQFLSACLSLSLSLSLYPLIYPLFFSVLVTAFD